MTGAAPDLLLCPRCAERGHAVRLVRQGRFYGHEEGKRAKECSVYAFVEVPPQVPVAIIQKKAA